MEKKIQELKTKLLNDLEMFMHNSIEQFTSLLSDISNEYLVKTKERELELKDEVAKLSKDKDELIVYINGAKESAKDFTEKMEELRASKEWVEKAQSQHLVNEMELINKKEDFEKKKKHLQKQIDAFEKEKQQFQVQKAMVEEQVKTLRKLNI